MSDQYALAWTLKEEGRSLVLDFGGKRLLVSSQKQFIRSVYHLIKKEISLKSPANVTSDSSDSDTAKFQQAKEMFIACCTRKLREKAIQILSCATISSAALSNKLLLLGVTQQIIDPILCELEQMGLLDQRRLRESLIHVAKRKRWSKAQLALKARQKGIDLEVDESHMADKDYLKSSNMASVAKFLKANTPASIENFHEPEQEEFSEEAEYDAAYHLVMKWAAQMQSLPQPERQRKIMARLGRRGFGPELIYRLQDEM